MPYHRNAAEPTTPSAAQRAAWDQLWRILLAPLPDEVPPADPADGREDAPDNGAATP